MNLAFAKTKGSRHGRVHAAALPFGATTVCDRSTNRDNLVETENPVNCKRCLKRLS